MSSLRRLLDRLRQLATELGCQSAQSRDDDLRVAPRGKAGPSQAGLAVFQELVGARSGDPPRGDKHASPLGIDIELFDSDQHFHLHLVAFPGGEINAVRRQQCGQVGRKGPLEGLVQSLAPESLSEDDCNNDPSKPPAGIPAIGGKGFRWLVHSFFRLRRLLHTHE